MFNIKLHLSLTSLKHHNPPQVEKNSIPEGKHIKKTNSNQ